MHCNVVVAAVAPHNDAGLRYVDGLEFDYVAAEETGSPLYVLQLRRIFPSHVISYLFCDLPSARA